MDLLRKKDLVAKTGIPNGTLTDWISDFNVYIPKTAEGRTTYYKPEVIDVLLFIKKCKEQRLEKHIIFELLAEKGFTLTVDEAVEDVKKALEGDSPRDTLLAVMQTTGQAVAKLVEVQEVQIKQEERLDEQEESLKTLENTVSVQDERMEKLEKRTDEVELLKQQFEDLQKLFVTASEELNQTKQELAAVKEEKQKGFFARLFGK